MKINNAYSAILLSVLLIAPSASHAADLVLDGEGYVSSIRGLEVGAKTYSATFHKGSSFLDIWGDPNTSSSVPTFWGNYAGAVEAANKIMKILGTPDAAFEKIMEWDGNISYFPGQYSTHSGYGCNLHSQQPSGCDSFAIPFGLETRYDDPLVKYIIDYDAGWGNDVFDPNYMGWLNQGGFLGSPIVSFSEVSGTSPMSPVPEPETYAMMLAGLGLLGVMTRRRRQKLNA